MSISKSLYSYKDCFDAMDRAISDPIGIRIRQPSLEKANYFRMRCHQARVLDRKNNLAVYPDTHPMHGISVYDPLMLRLTQDGDQAWIVFERIELDIGNVESLSTGKPIAIETEPQLQLESKPPAEDIVDGDFEIVDAEPTLEDFNERILKPMIRRRV